MKNARPWVVILVSIVIGAAAVAVAARWVAHQANIATTQVVVAARDLDVGTRLRPDMVQVVEWPAGTPLNEPFTDTGKVVDRVINAQVLRGEPIVAAKLAAPGASGGLSAVLGDGKRAITVRVNEIVGVAGFALPGNYVDVMVNAQQDKDKGEEGRQISKTVLERVLVLAVAQEAGRDDTKPKVVSAVTLELSLEDSEKLDLARSVGTLSLVLRNQVDSQTVATAGITKNQLFGAKDIPTPVVMKVVAESKPSVPRARPIALPAQPSQCVEVVQNANRVLSCF